MKKRIMSALIVLSAVSVMYGYTYYDTNKFELISDIVTVELGEKLDSNNPAEYVIGHEERVSEAEVDLSQVDCNKVGEYDAAVRGKKKELDFKVVVKDTTAPEMKLKDSGEFKVIQNKELSALDMIENCEDLGGVKKIEVKDRKGIIEKEPEEDRKDILWASIAFRYEEPGTYENSFIAMDENGNETEEKFTVKVIKDYLAHVKGIQDISFEEGSSKDYMKEITYDESVTVTVDATGVDSNTPGEYKAVYIIKGDDGETVVKKEIKVTVTEKVVMQSSQTYGGLSGSYGKGTRSPGGTLGGGSSSSGGSSGGSSGSSSGGSSGGGTGSSSGGSSGGSSSRPAGSTGTGTTTGSGEIDPDGNTWEGGTWNWD